VALKPVDVQASPKLKIYFGEARAEGKSIVKATSEIQVERIVSCELHSEAKRALYTLDYPIFKICCKSPISWSAMTDFQGTR